jgi:hypothetical protein
MQGLCMVGLLKSLAQEKRNLMGLSGLFNSSAGKVVG